MNRIIILISRSMPALPVKLKQAGIKQRPEEFIKRALLSAFYMTIGLAVVFAGFLSKQPIFVAFLMIVLPIVFVMGFFYFLRLPDVVLFRKTREVNAEIIDSGRFLVVSLESGVPLFETMRAVSKNFPHVGAYFKQVIDDASAGNSIEDSLNIIIDDLPSQDLRRIFWQILNSLRTGANIASSLKHTLDQIGREHLIEVRQYGYKLNPLAMAYMILAVIVPSLSVTLLVVFSSFISFTIDLVILLMIAGFLGCVQLMFLAIAKSSRPAVNM